MNARLRNRLGGHIARKTGSMTFQWTEQARDLNDPDVEVDGFFFYFEVQQKTPPSFMRLMMGASFADYPFIDFETERYRILNAQGLLGTSSGYFRLHIVKAGEEDDDNTQGSG